MATALGTLLNGLDQGSIYGLIALGLAVIFRTTGVVDFARGPVVMAGAAIGAIVEAQAGPVAALAAAAALCAAVGLLEFLLSAALPQDNRLAASLIATLGFGIAVSAVVAVVMGGTTRAVPALFSSQSFTLGDQVVFIDSVAALAVLLIATAATAVAIQRTGAGRRLRAVAEDREVAALRGINVTVVTAASFVAAGVLAGIAGIVLPAATGRAVVLDLAPLYTIYGFVAMVVGGTGSWWGPAAGGWVVGMVEAAGAQIWHDGSLQPLFGLGALLVVLLVRPEGIFASPELRRA